MPNDSNHSIELQYLGYPTVLDISRTFHTFFIPCSFVTNLFTAYVVQTQSYTLHGRLRTYLIINQLICTVKDLIISGFCQPVLFLPYWVYATTGPLNSFLSTFTQMCICLASVSFTIAFCCNLAFHQYQLVLPYASKWKIRKPCVLHSVNIFSVLFWTALPLVCYSVTFQNQNDSKVEFLKKYPWSEDLMADDFVYVSVPIVKHSYLPIAMATFAIFWGTIIVTLPFSCMKAIDVTGVTMSEQKKNEVKSMTKRLFLQIFLSLSIIIVPSCYFIYSLVFHFNNSCIAFMNTATVWMYSMQSFFSSIFILIIWKSYRKYALKRLCIPLFRSSRSYVSPTTATIN